MHRSVGFPKSNAHLNCSSCKHKRCKGCGIKCAPVPLTKVQLKHILQSFDKNGDCRLSKQELKNALDYIGSHFPNWRASRALNRTDGNKDGYISEDEMDDLVDYVWQCGEMVFFFSKEKHIPTSLKADRDAIVSLFKRCDVNKDGRLSKDEVKAGFRLLQSRFPNYRAQRAFKVADENGDGYISESELDELVKYVLECYEGNIQLRLIN
ncbi:hypothetical protein DITRI_Ditri10aG0041500 [Diplodiscus trichospermus]